MKDTNIYRVTYTTGLVKIGSKAMLGGVVAAARTSNAWMKRPVKIERAPAPEWTDVTGEFLG
jgi:hypothetical protein